jgi:hypothetical protein
MVCIFIKPEELNIQALISYIYIYIYSPFTTDYSENAFAT